MRETNTKKTIILGMGNELFGDDGAGIEAAKKLAKLFADDDTVTVKSTNWGGFRIIDLLSGFDNAVIIDAIKTGVANPGEIFIYDYSEFVSSVRMVSFHDINFSTAVRLGNKLGYLMPKKITIYAIEAETLMEFSEKLSETVNKAVNKCVEIVKNDILKRINKIEKINNYKVGNNK